MKNKKKILISFAVIMALLSFQSSLVFAVEGEHPNIPNPFGETEAVEVEPPSLEMAETTTTPDPTTTTTTTTPDPTTTTTTTTPDPTTTTTTTTPDPTTTTTTTTPAPTTTTTTTTPDPTTTTTTSQPLRESAPEVPKTGPESYYLLSIVAIALAGGYLFKSVKNEA